MVPWILLLIVPLLCGIFYGRSIKMFGHYVDISFIFAFLVLFLFRAFRADTVGGDLENYKEAYSYLVDFDLKSMAVISASGYESGFVVYNALLNKITDNFQIELIATALITTFGLLKGIYDNSKNPGASLYIYITMYFYGATFNNERQAISMAILLMSLIYIKQRKIYRFLLLVFIAALFHTTSLAFAIMYPLYNLKLSKIYWILALFFAIVFYAFGGFIINLLVSSIYYDKYHGADLMVGGGYIYFALLLILVLSSFVFAAKEQKANPNKRIWIHMLVVATIMQILSFNMGFFFRAVKLFSISMIFYIPEMLDDMHNKRLAQFGKFSVYTLLCVYYIYSLSNDSINLVPYKNILFN